jgi:hypothetical protein
MDAGLAGVCDKDRANECSDIPVTSIRPLNSHGHPLLFFLQCSTSSDFASSFYKTLHQASSFYSPTIVLHRSQLNT